MKVIGTFEKAKHYIEAHTADSDNRLKRGGPCITISRETGTGADRIGEALIEYFNQYNVSFTLFDKNLIDKVLEDHSLPQKLSTYLHEGAFPALKTAMNELVGLHPSMMSLMQKTAQTILQLGELGNVIIVGRGANLITVRLRSAFHIRLVGPLDLRIKNMETFYGMSPKEAADFVKKEDIARHKYIQANFNRDSTDPSQYHLILNTGLLTNQQIAGVVGDCIVKKYPERFQ